MMPPLSLDNVLAYSVQVAVLTAVGGWLIALARLRAPAARLPYWRALLLACLILPLLQPWVDAPGVSVSTVAATIDEARVADAAAFGGFSLPIAWTGLLSGVWLAGAIGWLVRLTLGLCRLRALRRAGEIAQLAPDVREIGERLNISADVRWVADLSQPVTFGVRHPVVLLPGSLRTMSMDVQRAVMAHELFHVIRRDWIWVLAEELVRAALWFHPAVWWLLAQVQLAREQVVDELAVLLLGRRRSYMQALLVCADRAALAPVPAFSRRRQLFQRLTHLSAEVTMSRTRVVASFAIIALGVLVSGHYTVGAFPLHGEPEPGAAMPQETSAPGPVGLEKIVHVDPQFPADVSLDRIRMLVRLRITVDERGNVTHADDLGLRFTAGRGTRWSARGLAKTVPEVVREAVLQWKYEPPGQPMATIIAVQVGNPTREDPPPPVRVGGDVGPPTRIHSVQPVYPVEAQAARVHGVVIIEATIGTDGTVEDARVLKSIPMLDEAALDAVTQWEYTPTMMNGVPVPVIMTVTVNFTLQD